MRLGIITSVVQAYSVNELTGYGYNSITPTVAFYRITATRLTRINKSTKNYTIITENMPKYLNSSSENNKNKHLEYIASVKISKYMVTFEITAYISLRVYQMWKNH